LAIHAAANIFNCLASGIWLIYTLACGQCSDAYTSLGCSFDAAAVQLIVIIHVVGLALMAFDRLASIRNAEFATEERGISVSGAAMFIGIAWLCSIGLSLPLAVKLSGMQKPSWK